MQNLKDTFYLMLRDRIAAANPARTVVVRGAVRPGVVVAENELPAAGTPLPPDVFWVGWTGLSVNPEGALPMTAMRCEVRYATDGTSGNAGMDRGRLLAGMDAELSAALSAVPQSVSKMQVANGAAVASDGTDVFWGDVAFEPEVTEGERVSRTATVEVFCHGE